MTDIAKLVPAQTDAAIAADLKSRLTGHLTEACSIMDEAKRHGLILEFQLGQDWMGRMNVTRLSVVKPL